MKKIILLLFTTAVLWITSGCERLVDGINADPNNPADAPADLMLTGAQLASISVHEGYNSLLASIWAGHYLGVDRQWADFQVYNVGATNFDGMWNSAYYGVYRNLLLARRKVEPAGGRVFAGIAKLMQAHTIGTMTALYGEVPFTQAAQIEDFPNARFDAQPAIYAGLQTLLDEAIADLRTNQNPPAATANIYFNGVTPGAAPNWIQVAYTLKARFYVDTRQYALAAAAAAQGIQTPAGAMYIPHGTTLNQNQNFIFNFLALNRAGDAAAVDRNNVPAYLVSILDPTRPATYRGNAKTDETARFNFYYLRAGVNVAGRVEPNTVTRANLVGFVSQAAPFPLVTFQENKLTLAETSARAGDFAAALGHLNDYRAYLRTGGYINPITFANNPSRYLAYEPADFEPGGMENTTSQPTSLSATDALLREVLEERYVSFYCQTLAWNDERRTRGTNVGVRLTPTAGTRLPNRFLISQNEKNGNVNAPTPVPTVFDVMPIYR